MIRSNKFLSLGSFLLCILAIALFGFIGMEKNMIAGSPASSKGERWAGYWRNNKTDPKIILGKELVPTTIPGPADGWAGGKTRGITLLFETGKTSPALQIDFYETHESSPPTLLVKLDGVEIARIKTPAGEGKPAPYREVKREFRQTVPLGALEAGNHTISIMTIQGSWYAPADIRIVGTDRYNYAKGLYRLLTGKYLFYLFCSFLLLAFLLYRLTVESPAKAVATSILFLGSITVTLFVSEALFRFYLIEFPQKRSASTVKKITGADLKGAGLTYASMVRPHPDPDISYALKPDLDGFFAGHPLKTNSRGFRGSEVAIKKKEGTVRIAGIGDSVMFGWGVSNDETLLSVLAGKIKTEKEIDAEPINFACPSYNLQVENSVYSKVAVKFSPDLVIILAVKNDLEVPGLMIEPVRPFTLRHSYIKEQLRRFLAKRWIDAPVERDDFVSSRHIDAIKKKGGELTEKEKWRMEVFNYYAQKTGESRLAGIMNEFAEVIKENGAVGVLVYYPEGEVSPSTPVTEDEGIKILSAGKSAGLLTIDMTPAIKEMVQNAGAQSSADILWVNKNDWHPNRAGHRLMAQKIFELLKSRSILQNLPHP